MRVLIRLTAPSQDIPLDGSRFEATLKMVEEIRALI